MQQLDGCNCTTGFPIAAAHSQDAAPSQLLAACATKQLTRCRCILVCWGGVCVCDGDVMMMWGLETTGTIRLASWQLANADDLVSFSCNSICCCPL